PQAGGDRGRGDRRGHHGLADAGVGAGDQHQAADTVGGHAPTPPVRWPRAAPTPPVRSCRPAGADPAGPPAAADRARATTTPTARSNSSPSSPALTVSRSRERPSGVDGGRKQPTATPRSRQAAAQAVAVVGSGAVTDSTPPAGSPVSSPAARSRATVACTRARSRARRSSPRRASRTAARAPAATAGGSAVSKMNVRPVSTRWRRSWTGPATTPPDAPSALD